MIEASHSVLSSALQGRSLSHMTENILTEIYLMETPDVPATDLLEITQAPPNVSTRRGGKKMEWNGGVVYLRYLYSSTMNPSCSPSPMKYFILSESQHFIYPFRKIWFVTAVP